MGATFSFTEFENDDSVVAFKYHEVTENGSERIFTEKLELPKELNLSALDESLRLNILSNVHLVLGISYWKLNCAPQINIPYKLTQGQVDFWNAVYKNGLGEFFFTNKLDVSSAPEFPTDSNAIAQPQKLQLQNTSLLGFSGGKDSLVANKILADAGKQFTPFTVETNRNQAKILNMMPKAALVIERTLDPVLLEPNKYNGHVPVSAIIGWIGVLVAALTNNSYVIVGNEHSASESNTTYQGMEINHQWSKSEEFEDMFRSYVQSYVSPDITYFSLLRSYSELKIVQIISKSPTLLENFVSCNKNFQIKSTTDKKWCGECAKCASTFALLSAFIDKPSLLKMFGKNLYVDKNLIPLYQALLGVEGIKPFDCVGSLEEIQLSFWQANQKGGYKSDLAMQLFDKEVLPKLDNPAAKLEELLAVRDTNSLPDEFKSVLAPTT